MEKLKFEEQGDVQWSYDKEADVLYLSFGKPQPAMGLELGDGFLARYRETDGELVGFTILDASRLLAKGAKAGFVR